MTSAVILLIDEADTLRNQRDQRSISDVSPPGSMHRSMKPKHAIVCFTQMVIGAQTKRRHIGAQWGTGQLVGNPLDLLTSSRRGII